LLQAAGGDDLVALGQLELGSVFAKGPVEAAHPVLCHGTEVQQHNAQAQLAVQVGGVVVGPLDKGNESIVDREAIGLSV